MVITKPLLFLSLFVALFDPNLDEIDRLSIDFQRQSASCEQVGFNEYIVHSENQDGCLVFGFVNFQNKISIDLQTFDSDTNAYYWWVTGQFQVKTKIKRLNAKSSITLPNNRSNRLYIKTECGSAKIKLNLN